MKPYYSHDGIEIYNGDARLLPPFTDAWREIFPFIPRVDLVLTDPPYGIGLSNHNTGGHSSRPMPSTVNYQIAGDPDTQAGERVLEWAAKSNLPTIAFASPWKPWPGKWRNLIVWDKGGAVGGGGDTETCLKRSWELIQVRDNGALQGSRRESVWRFPIVPQDTALHPAAKPVALIVALLEQFGGESVIDPFMGSGTTLVAAKRLGRKAIGIEIEEKYCAIAAERLERERLTLFEHAGITQPQLDLGGATA